MSEKRKRPVRVTAKRFNSASGKNEDWIFDGLFHEFGVEAQWESDQGFGNYTIAIIEDQDGKVHTINPNFIQFTDK